jgi:Tfp pilus tip-associated adhesin PilY1
LPGQSTTAQSTWNPATDTVTIGSNAPAPMFLQRKLLSDSTNSRIICSGANATLNTSTSPASCANESGPAMDWSIYGGWYVPLPDAGERVNVDPNLSLGTLTFASNVPASNACTSGGYAWLNYIDYQTGLAVQNTVPQVSTKVGNSLIVGITVIKLPGGSLSAVATTSDNQQMNLAPSFSPTTFQGRRNLWREFEVY